MIAGSPWMAGAAQFNLEAAQAMGCGMLHALVDPAIYPILQAACPHVVYHPNTLSEADLTALLNQSDAVAIGSGCDHLANLETLLERVLRRSSVPVILDAAALRCLARHPEWLNTPHGAWILTPHVGEFLSLIHISHFRFQIAPRHPSGTAQQRLIVAAQDVYKRQAFNEPVQKLATAQK